MSIPINQNRTEIKERDGYREKCFKEAYGVDCQIRTKNVNDQNWDWLECLLTFKDIHGSLYQLDEIYKKGNDNSTDYVDFRYADDSGMVQSEKFKTHLEAELRMVEIMKGRL